MGAQTDFMLLGSGRVSLQSAVHVQGYCTYGMRASSAVICFAVRIFVLFSDLRVPCKCSDSVTGPSWQVKYSVGCPVWQRNVYLDLEIRPRCMQRRNCLLCVQDLGVMSRSFLTFSAGLGSLGWRTAACSCNVIST